MNQKNVEVLIGNNGTKNAPFDLIKFFGLIQPTEEMIMPLYSIRSITKWVLILPLLLTACGSQTTRLPIQSVSAFKSIMVVAIEPPPLEVIPDLLESRFPAYRHFNNMDILPYSVQSHYRSPGGILISGQTVPDDVVATEALDHGSVTAQPQKDRLASFKQGDLWMPTFELASAAAGYLTQNKFQAIASASYFPLSVSRSDPGAWRKAVEQWYENQSTQVDYRSFSENPVDAVVEIGISRYRLFEGQFSLQVLIKVIDPASKKVVAKTDLADYSFRTSAQALLEPDGAAFKALLRSMGTCLLKQGFQEIGLFAVNSQAGELSGDIPYCSV